MILVRILIGIISIPFVLVAFLLQLLLRLVVMLGGRIMIGISSLIFLGGAIILAIDLFGSGEDIGGGLWIMLGGLVGYSLPYIAVYIIALLETFIQWVRGFVFGR